VGVRIWSEFLARLEGRQYTFRHCSLAFASQAAMVPMVLAGSTVLSTEAPYRCDACDREVLRLVESKTLVFEHGRVHPPHLRCSACGGPLEFDDIPERYFAFLSSQ
jgi:hypothetical protein